VIQERGITPNIKASMTPEQEKALLLRHREVALSPADQKFVSEQRDPQLERAVDAIKGMMVYSQNGSAAPVPEPPKAEDTSQQR
jgi:hypothetical protein